MGQALGRQETQVLEKVHQPDGTDLTVQGRRSASPGPEIIASDARTGSRVSCVRSAQKILICAAGPTQVASGGNSW
ncbi:hypothetical protein ElyMa_003323700 [Elysia marginata]|uniref:Uncharacterized protein n=1 Tax=Elysia marginata TaxID=1093978 RepID=A0AAV4JGL5_9GAST|nr:hypothetical protein ElyMa_003323700 [Elysia marginata]